MNCPTCGKPAKGVKGKGSWYYCRNLSCNMTAFEAESKEGIETMADKISQQVELLRKFNITAYGIKCGEPKLDIRNGYVGKGVSLTTEKGEAKLSLTGGWFNLAELQEHFQALQRGMTILEALSDINSPDREAGVGEGA